MKTVPTEPGANSGTGPDPTPDRETVGSDAVFISYSREDADFVGQLQDALIESGYPCWVDTEGIRPTAKWMEEVRSAIDRATAFVFVASPASAASGVCREEVEHAVRSGKRILPVALDDVDADSMHEAVAGRDWIFMRRGDDFAAAIRALRRALDTDPEWAATHARLLVRATEWDKRGRDASFALRGRDLADAERWLTEADERKDPQPARIHTEYIFASRRAATRTQRARMVALGLGLVIAVGLAIFALVQRNQARQQAREARSRELAARALVLRATNPEAGLLVAVQATRVADTPEAELAVRETIAQSYGRGVLAPPGGSVNSAALSSDGQFAATASDRGGVRIWRVHTGRPLDRLDPGPGRATDVSFSRNSKHLLTTTSGGAVDLWDVKTGQMVRSLHGLKGAIVGAAFSPGGRLVIAGGARGVAVWRTSGGMVSRLKGNRAVWGVAFGPAGRQVVTAGRDGAARVWDAGDGKLVRKLRLQNEGVGPGAAVNSAEFSPDGNSILTASDDGSARIWSLKSGDAPVILPSGSPMNAASFSRDGREVVTGSVDGETRVWAPGPFENGSRAKPRTGRLLATLRAPSGRVNSASFGAGDRTVITAGSDGVARLWNTGGADAVRIYRGHRAEVLGAGWSPDGSRVVTSSADDDTRIWNPGTGSTMHVLRGDSGPVWSAEFDGAGTRVVTASQDGDARIWDARRGVTLARLTGKSGIYSAAFSPDGRRVATAGIDGSVRIWSAKGGRPAETFDATLGGLTDLAFSPSGNALLTVGERGARLWNAASGRLLRTLHGHTQVVNSGAFSPDGRTVVTASEDGTARTWNAASGDQVGVLRGNLQGVESAAFSPDGSEIATGGADDSVRVWDAGSDQLLDTLHGPTDVVNSVAFSPDSGRILAASYDGRAYILRCRICVPFEQLRRLANRRIREGLTSEERAQYLKEAG